MFHPCMNCGGEAVEQVRGDLKWGDRDFIPDRPYSDTGVPIGPLFHPEQQGSNAVANALDTRVSCSQCDNSTGWNKREYADYTRFKWDRDNPEIYELKPSQLRPINSESSIPDTPTQAGRDDFASLPE